MKNCFIDAPTRSLADLTEHMVDDFSWTVNRIKVTEGNYGRGIGSRLLAQILLYADIEGIALTLEINPYGPLNYEQLESWYKRHGFIDHPEFPHWYIRYPSAPPD